MHSRVFRSAAARTLELIMLLSSIISTRSYLAAPTVSTLCFPSSPFLDWSPSLQEGCGWLNLEHWMLQLLRRSNLDSIITTCQTSDHANNPVDDERLSCAPASHDSCSHWFVRGIIIKELDDGVDSIVWNNFLLVRHFFNIVLIAISLGGNHKIINSVAIWAAALPVATQAALLVATQAAKPRLTLVTLIK